MEEQLDPITPSPSSWPEPPIATPEELHRHDDGIFFGRYGMRAGWSIAIFLVCAVIVLFIASVAGVASTGKLHDIIAAKNFAKAHPNLPKPKINLPFVPQMVIVNDGVSFLGLFGVCWLFSKAERRPLRSYGVGSYRVRDLIPGAFWGLIALSIVVGILYAGHFLVFDGQNVHGTQALLFGIGWLLAFLAVGFSEEYTFRGYIQYTLMRGFWGLAEKISPTNPRPWAFALSGFIWSLLFACAHLSNGGENFFGLVQVFMAGVVFVYALWRTGSLWWGIGMHMTWDWAQSFLFGVADSGNISVGRLFITHPQGKPLLSGGADGPEGSIFATVMLVLLLFVIRFTARPGMQPSIEQEPKPTQPSLVPEFHTPVA